MYVGITYVMSVHEGGIVYKWCWVIGKQCSLSKTSLSYQVENSQKFVRRQTYNGMSIEISTNFYLTIYFPTLLF